VAVRDGRVEALAAIEGFARDLVQERRARAAARRAWRFAW
jgi:hypothetical protein